VVLKAIEPAQAEVSVAHARDRRGARFTIGTTVPNSAAEALAIILLVLTLAGAITRPKGLPEAALAVPAAAAVLLSGSLHIRQVRQVANALGPTLGFLAAVLVLAALCDCFGLFEVAGQMMARASRARPLRLLAAVFLVASTVTTVLSLDATVVLLTPVVLASVARLRLRSKPHVYACTHLANSASLLLPVSNLTNLLAYRASGLSFARFAATMSLPWLVAILAEWAVLRRFFAADLVGRGEVRACHDQGTNGIGPPDGSLLAAIVVGLTLAAFFVTSTLGVAPVFAALGGAAVLGVAALARRRATWREIGTAVDIPFLAFVLALGIVVQAVSVHGLGRLVARLLPGGASLGSLLALAALAALLANLINNLPAVLLLLPAASAIGPGAVLAVLIGVNTGPNLTYTGSLATLLWRRVLHREGEQPAIREFVSLGALSVPLVLTSSTVALWLSIRMLG
jgi:arsenical pump membrane protein